MWAGKAGGLRGVDGGLGASGGKSGELMGERGCSKDGEVGGSLLDGARGWLGNGEGDGSAADFVAA